MKKIISKKFKKRKFKIYIDTLIFSFILCLVLATVISSVFTNRITYFEVVQGEIVESDRFNAMILCDDRIEHVSDNGSIYFLSRSGEKASTATPVYCLDKTSSMEQIINSSDEENILNTETVNKIYNEIVSFNNSYNTTDYNELYKFKASSSAVLMNALSNKLIDSGVNNSLQLVRAPEPGYIFYFEDGYEGITTDNFTPEMLNYDEYSYKSLNKEGHISANDSAYKLVTSEDWTILFKLKEYQKDKYVEDDFIQVKFLEDNQIIWGQVELIERESELYCAVHFTNSMLRYADSRFANVEIIFSSEKGLKVPNSAIVVKELYTIPKDFAELSYSNIIINVHNTDEKGEVKISKENIEVYDETEEYYLVRTDDIEAQTVIIQEKTGNTYTISDTIPINGVYNINRGFAKFNEVTILTQNDDFSIIQPNSTYGLVEFDHIVLNGNSVENEEIINKTSE